MSDKLLVRLHPSLKDLIAEDADRQKISGGMGELVVRLLAQHYKRPDLGYVPRKKMGRPRKRFVQPA